MKAKFIITACVFLASSSVFAGVAEKKMQRTSEATMAASTEKVKVACGNAQLDTSISWDKFEGFVDNNAVVVENGFTKRKVFEEAGDTAKAVLESFVRVCEDADYKAEIKKVTRIVFAPNDNVAANKTSALLDGTTVNMLVPGTGSSLSVDSVIEKLF